MGTRVRKAPFVLAALLACSACESVLFVSPDGRLDVEDPDAVWGFSFVRDFLAGLPRPGVYRTLDEDLAWMADQGITLLVSLTVTATSSEQAAEHGIELLHLPVADFTAPSQEQFEIFVSRTNELRDSGGKAAVHCAAGRGRTGTMLAAWFISEGMSAQDAIDEIRELRPGSIETASQIEALHQFAGEDGRPDEPAP